VNLANVALLAARLPQNLDTERLLQLTQRAIIQLDQRDPMPSVQRSHSRTKHHASTVSQASRTLGGGPNPRRGDNRQHNQDN
jgi:hypothetical protein